MQTLSKIDLQQINLCCNARVLNDAEGGLLLTDSELKTLVQFLADQDSAIYDGTTAPPALPFLSKLQDLVR